MKRVKFNEKTAVATFWATIGEIGLLFIIKSGHTGTDAHKLTILY